MSSVQRSASTLACMHALVSSWLHGNVESVLCDRVNDLVFAGFRAVANC